MTEFADIIRRELTGRIQYGVEVGVSCGKSSAALLRAFPGLRLYMIDAWTTYPTCHTYRQSGDGHARRTQEQQDGHMRQAIAATEFAARWRNVLRLTSMEASWGFDDGVLDFCVLDDDHTFGAVMAGLHQWSPKVRLGGLLLGHDFRHPRNKRELFGVDKAVTQFAGKFGRKLRSEGDVWWFEPEGA
jgi:hypothetical protein